MTCHDDTWWFDPQEYIIDDGLGVKKTDFLRRAMAYHTIVHPNILPLEAIFFSKVGIEADITKLLAMALQFTWVIMCTIVSGSEARTPPAAIPWTQRSQHRQQGATVCLCECDDFDEILKHQ